MATWAISIPISGNLYIEVEAETEEEAFGLAEEHSDISHMEEWHESGDYCVEWRAPPEDDEPETDKPEQ